MYGANYVVAKGLMPGIIGPNGFILLRVLGAVSLFWLIYFFIKQKIDRKDFVRLAICGLFGVAVNQLMFFNGLMLTSPVNAPVIMTTTPILVLLLSWIILKEKIRPLQGIGILLGAAGSILFVLQNSGDGFANEKGDVFIFLNATSYAIYLVLAKPLMAKYNPLTVITWVFTFGLCYISIWTYSWPEFTDVHWSSLTSSEILRLAFVVVGVTFLPYLLNVYALKKVSPSIVAVYIYLQPILAAFFVFLSARFGMTDYRGDMSWEKLITALIVFVGVYLVIKPKKQLKA